MRLTLQATGSTVWPTRQVLRVQIEEANSRTDLSAQERAVGIEHMDRKHAEVTSELVEAKEERKVDSGGRAVVEKQ